MAPFRSCRLRLAAGLAPLLLLRCDPKPDSSSETHFVSCETSPDCAPLGPGYACIAGKCQIPAAPVPDGGGAPASRDSGKVPPVVDGSAGGSGGAGGSPPDAGPIEAQPDAALDGANTDASSGTPDGTADAAPDATDGATAMADATPRELAWGPVRMASDSLGVLGPSASRRLAVAADGSAIAAWVTTIGSETRLVATHLDSTGTTWSPPTVLDATANSSMQPTVTMTEDGVGMVAWVDTVASDAGTLRVVSAARYAGAWEPPVDISPVHPVLWASVSMAADAHGGFVAAWLSTEGTGPAPLSWRPGWAEYTASGWAPPVTVTLTEGDTSERPHVAVSAAGHALISWFEFRNSDGAAWVRAVRRSPASVWSAIETPASITPNLYGPGSPSGAVDSTGRSSLLWTEADSLGIRGVVMASDFATTWTPPVRLDTGLGTASAPVLVGSEDGYFLASWGEALTGGCQLEATTRAPGGSWAPLSVLDTPATAADGGLVDSSCSPLGAVVTPGGWAALAWERQPASSGAADLHGAVYAPGSGFSESASLGTGTTQASFVGDPQRNAMVLYRDSTNELLSVRCTEAAGWGAPLPIPGGEPPFARSFLGTSAGQDGLVVTLWNGSSGVGSNSFR